MGFEPMIPRKKYTDLANQRYQPLSHPYKVETNNKIRMGWDLNP